MTNAGNTLLAMAIVSALCGVVAAIMIGSELQKRGVKINWILFRVLLVSKYLGQYRDVTRQETGRPGSLYYMYVMSMILALVLAVIGLILRAA